VKLLFDENLSPTLVRRLAAAYPDSAHVRDVGLRGQSDAAIWEYAQRHGFAVTSKDTDFRDLSFLRGAPPKVLWRAVGNAGTEAIARLLEARRLLIETFAASAEEALLVVELPNQDGA
jgi:predicted nuclease of predicted toxin-antitoxin system